MSGPPLLVFCNRHSGAGSSWAHAERVARACGERGLAAELRETTRDGSCYAEVDPAGQRAVVVVGGDGSVHAAANVLPAGVPLAFVGTGTVNVLSLELGLPTEPAEVAELVLRGRSVEIPLLEAGGRRFVLFAEAGWLGAVVGRVNRWRERKGRHGKLEFVGYGAAGMATSRGRPLEATVRTTDGAEHRGRYANVLLTRARTYGGSMRMPLFGQPGGALQEEAFTFVGERAGGPVGHALYLAAGHLRALRGGRLVDRLHARRVTLDGPRGTGVHLDAETDGAPGLPLEVGPAGSTVRLLVP